MRTKIKVFLAAFLFLLPFVLLLGADNLPEYNPGKKLYQRSLNGFLGIGRFYKEVKLPEVKTKEEARLEAEIDRIKAETKAFNQKLEAEAKEQAHGRNWMRIGVALFIAGSIAFILLKHYHLELLGVAGALGGVGSICYGAIIIKIAEHPTAIAVASIAAACLAIAAYFCHGRGIGIKESVARFAKNA